MSGLDFMLCGQSDCPRKDKCWRYHKWKEFRNEPFVAYNPMVYSPESTPEDCDMFMSIKSKYDEFKNNL